MLVEKGRVSLILTRVYLDGLARLVDEGLYMERQDAIRAAIRLLMEKHGVPPFYLEAKDDEYAGTAP